MFSFLKNRRQRKKQAKAMYSQIVAQSRRPEFYKDMGVPDNLDGRFDMIALHCYIMMRRLNQAGQEKLSQKLFDVFFVTMDRSLREMGIGDLGVPKHMKRMMQGFNGRVHQYETALSADDRAGLMAMLSKNIYGVDATPNPSHLAAFTDYMIASATMDSTEAEFATITMNTKVATATSPYKGGSLSGV